MAQTQPRFYTLAWRWHFYAGLFVVPVLLMLALTGIVYLFKSQLDVLMYRQQLIVAAQGKTVSADAQLATVKTAYPGLPVKKFVPPPAADRSSAFTLARADGGTQTIYVDPYRNTVLGEMDDSNNLQAIARKLHGKLLLGKAGDFVVEMAASWALVLLVSGLYLWWPRGGGIWGTLLPRLRASKRIFWRDLHAVAGFWGALLLAFMLLSGLPWSGIWGAQYAKVWSRFPAQMWDDVPKSNQLAASLNTDADKSVPWAVENTPLPQSHAEHSGEHHHDGASSATPITSNVTLAQLQALGERAGLPGGYSISLPGSADGVYTLSVFPDDPRQEQTIHVDQYSGKVLAQTGWRDYGLVPRAVEMGVALHEGKFFGLANQLLMLCACLFVILMCVTGSVMWWQRRPTGRLGAPTTPRQLPRWKTGTAIFVALAVLFPTVGISIMVILLADLLVLRRLVPLKRAIS
ncbi:PepSY-associated TM helix domain-containing protein [Andreprevotia chitinilytica]|uniref:PepSY-associated TM helix domain-containing protein n=1 Tax=Andreprevotia chitinilytica TaxID=396808 RepID=UPI0005556F14|nr:PepSY domain-containing protein [Andreprevotia chitinilytica]